MRVGDRVECDYLGAGTVTEKVGRGLVMVCFDRTPPADYNMGVNPCLQMVGDLKKSAPTATSDPGEEAQ